MKTQYETERLLLRLVSTDDAPFILKLMNSEKWIKFIGDRKVYTETEAQKYIRERMYPRYEKGYYNYLVINRQTSEKMGCCGIYKRDHLEIPDIGFAYLPQFEGQGFAYDAATKVMEIARQERGMTKISGITLEDNLASRKLLEKLGLKFQKKFFVEGDPEELMYYEGQL